mgnify:CR=1 FL=1
MPDATATWQDMMRSHADCIADGRVGVAPRPRRPAAAVLACSDARVPPSVIFGHAGELFVVRLAGNSATPGAIASLTYAVDHLHTDLVVVLGHTGCGAVEAALSGHAPATLGPILTPIDEMLASCDGCSDLDAAVAGNVRHNVRRLQRDRGPLGRSIATGRVQIRGAVHDLATGRLTELETSVPAIPTHRTPHPTRSTP